jgi:hypothetical protein
MDQSAVQEDFPLARDFRHAEGVPVAKCGATHRQGRHETLPILAVATSFRALCPAHGGTLRK